MFSFPYRTHSEQVHHLLLSHPKTTLSEKYFLQLLKVFLEFFLEVGKGFGEYENQNAQNVLLQPIMGSHARPLSLRIMITQVLLPLRHLGGLQAPPTGGKKCLVYFDWKYPAHT